MKKKKEELGRLHKQTCLELKKMRAEMAEKLGIDLKQTECTYEGYCSGTCPKCKKEEMMLNAALLKTNMEKAGIASRVAVVGAATVATLGMAGCNLLPETQLEGDVRMETEYLEEDTSASTEELEILEGDIAFPVEETEDEKGF
ncbi:MAG: hypothetical protein ACI4ES_09005 [Roseburia sp.]